MFFFCVSRWLGKVGTGVGAVWVIVVVVCWGEEWERDVLLLYHYIEFTTTPLHHNTTTPNSPKQLLETFGEIALLVRVPRSAEKVTE